MSEYLFIPDDDSEYGPVWEATEARQTFDDSELANAKPAELVLSLGGHRGHYLSADFILESSFLFIANQEDYEGLTEYETKEFRSAVAHAETYKRHQDLFVNGLVCAEQRHHCHHRRPVANCPRDPRSTCDGLCSHCEFIHDDADSVEAILVDHGYIASWQDGVSVWKVED